jgi:hypothetical protein
LPPSSTHQGEVDEDDEDEDLDDGGGEELDEDDDDDYDEDNDHLDDGNNEDLDHQRRLEMMEQMKDTSGIRSHDNLTQKEEMSGFGKHHFEEDNDNHNTEEAD